MGVFTTQPHSAPTPLAGPLRLALHGAWLLTLGPDSPPPDLDPSPQTAEAIEEVDFGYDASKSKARASSISEQPAAKRQKSA